MKEIVENSKSEQEAYLNHISIQQSDNPLVDLEDDNKIEIPKISKKEIEQFEVYAIILEFPSLIYKFLLWYFNELDTNPADITEELEKMSRFLNETGN